MNHENYLGVCNYAFLCKWIDRKVQVLTAIQMISLDSLEKWMSSRQIASSLPVLLWQSSSSGRELNKLAAGGKLLSEFLSEIYLMILTWLFVF